MKEILTKEDLEEIFNEADERVAPVLITHESRGKSWSNLYVFHHDNIYSEWGKVVVGLSVGVKDKRTGRVWDETYQSLVLSPDHPQKSIEEVLDACDECDNKSTVGEKVECLDLDINNLTIDTDLYCEFLKNYLANIWGDNVLADKKIDVTSPDVIKPLD